MSRTYHYLQYVDTGVRVIHEDGYVFGFPTVAMATENARELQRVYGVRTVVLDIESATQKLPLTPRERWILDHSTGVTLPGALPVVVPGDPEPVREIPVLPERRNIRVKRR